MNKRKFCLMNNFEGSSRIFIFIYRKREVSIKSESERFFLFRILFPTLSLA